MPEPYARPNLRRPGYDYRLAGGYFVTICLARREPRFGMVSEGRVVLSDPGSMVFETWQSLPDRYAGIILDDVIVMPDHLHGILFLTNGDAETGVSLSEIIRVFKSLTTTRYIAGVKRLGWPRFDRFLWQPDFYDHIIRNDADLDTRRRYIALNPSRWEAKRQGYE